MRPGGENPETQSPKPKSDRACNIRNLEIGIWCFRPLGQCQSRKQVTVTMASFGTWRLELVLPAISGGRVTDGTRTRNSQNHNLELYH